MTHDEIWDEAAHAIVSKICEAQQEADDVAEVLGIVMEVQEYGSFEALDRALALLPLDKLTDSVVLAILTQTCHSKAQLPSRDAFVDRVEQVLTVNLGSERTQRLMGTRR